MKSWLDTLHRWSEISRYHRFEIKSKSAWGADVTSVTLYYDTANAKDPIGVSISECSNELELVDYFPYEIQDDFGSERRTDYYVEVIDNFGNPVISCNNYYYEPWRVWLYGFNVTEDFNKMIPFAFEKFYEHFGNRPGVVQFDWHEYRKTNENKN